MEENKGNAYIEQSTAIVLVGGKSRRMNFKDKMSLKIGDESFLERILKEISFLKEIAISANAAQMEKLDIQALEEIIGIGKVRLIEDKFDDVGPIGGMYSVMSESESEYYFVVSCDMPLIKEEVIRQLYGYLESGDDAVIAVANGRIQPLFSIYKSTVEPVVLEQIKENNYRILDFYDKVQTRYVELSDNQCFTNMNTLEDYENIMKVYEKVRKS